MNTVNCRTSYLMEVKKLLPDFPSCIEIGVHRGEFSKQIYDILIPGFFALIDPFETGGKRYDEDMGFMNVSYSTDDDYNTVLKMFDSKSIVIHRDFSYNVVSTYDNKFFDFVYIDGSHLYEDVKRDLSDWMPKLKDGGIIAGHDYIPQPSFGVIHAVNEFCDEHGFKMILLNQSGGDFALKKI